MSLPLPRSTLFPYTTLFRSTRDADLAVGDDVRFDLVILDEAQRIKNRESKTAQAVRGLRRSRSWALTDRKSTRLNSSHQIISYAVFCLKKKKLTATKCRCMD